MKIICLSEGDDKMENSLISIIVPIYNVEKYIHQCIDSLINQTYKNIEIILVDDGSPDNCGEICDEYARKDKRIKVIHQNNMGLSGARNTGLDNSKGDYLIFVDSDDYIACDFIEKLYNISIKYGVDIVECDFEKFQTDIEVKKIEEKIKIFSVNEMLEKIEGEESVKSVVVWNKLYKRNIYESLRFPLGKINEDEFTTYKAFYNCETDIARTNLKLYYYRFHSASIMGKKFNLKRLDALEGIEERKKFYEDKKNEKMFLKTAIRYDETARFFYIEMYECVENSDEYLEKIYDKIRKNCTDMKEKGARIGIKTKLFILFPKMYMLLRKIKLMKTKNIIGGKNGKKEISY